MPDTPEPTDPRPPGPCLLDAEVESQAAGAPLSASAGAHLSACDACQARVAARRAGLESPRAQGVAGSPDSITPVVRPEHASAQAPSAPVVGEPAGLEHTVLRESTASSLVAASAPAPAPVSLAPEEPTRPAGLPGDEPGLDPDLGDTLHRTHPPHGLPPSGADFVPPPITAPVATPGSAAGALGRYVLLRSLGQGGMGQVYLAEDTKLGRQVALKLLRPEKATDALRVRLMREAQAMARLSHPNVVAIYDVDTAGAQLFISMEYVAGSTLADWLADGRGLRQVLEVFQGAGRGLAAAHAVGIVHRDFKPHNVLLGADGVARVTDFGVARWGQEPQSPGAARSGAEPADTSLEAQVPASVTVAGTLLGTPLYMSPEQLRGEPADGRSDQFSFCVALYEAVYGARPFAGQSLEELKRAVTEGKLNPPPASARVPAFVRDALARGLRPLPADRFPTMAALLEALSQAPLTAGRLRRVRARRLGLALGLLATVAVAVVSRTRPWQAFEERAEGAVLARRPLPWREDLMLVSVDEAALRRIGWPPRRHRFVRVVQAILAAGSREVAFDMFFNRPAADGAQADAELAAVLAGSGRAVLAAPCSVDPETHSADVLPTLGPLPGHGSVPAVACEHLLPPVPVLRLAGRMSHAALGTSASGAARGIFALAQVGDRDVPAFALAAYAASLGPTQQVESLGGQLRVGALTLPLTPDGQLLASFRRAPADQVISFGELLDAVGEVGTPVLPPELAERFRGAHVFFGETSQTAGDRGLFATGDVLPKVLLHAMVFSDLLDGAPVRELPVRWQLVAMLLIGSLLAGAALTLRPRLLPLAPVIALLGVTGATLLAWTEGRVLVPPLGLLVAAAAAFAAALAARVSSEERDRGRLRAAFGATVHSTVFEAVMEDPERLLSLEGARKPVSVLCVLVEQGAPSTGVPEEVLRSTRAWLGALAKLCVEGGGRLEVLRTNAVLATFGDVVAGTDHAARALRIALQLVEGVRQAGGPLSGLRLRLGVATGEAYVGDLGDVESGSGRIQFAVLGPPVDLAWRLAALAAEQEVVASHEAWELGATAGLERLPQTEALRRAGAVSVIRSATARSHS